MRFVRQILFCLLSALLFFISWPPNSFPIFSFFAFVPILWFVFNFNTGKKVFSTWFLYLSLVLTFFVLNFSLTSWVMNAHWGGGLFASCLNTFLMSTVLILVYKIKKKHLCYLERKFRNGLFYSFLIFRLQRNQS